jgi:hypothetical protein
MKIKFCLFLLLICYAYFASAQQKPTAPKISKFGQVDLKEFETKVTGVDSAARGVKLFDVGSCNFEVSDLTGSFVYVFERHVRFKVLNKTGYDLADFEIALYRGSADSQEALHNMEAATYNLENNAIVVSKLAKNAKFSEKHDKNWTVKKITLPNVKEGSIIEYKYKIKSDFIFNLRDWYFQGSTPALYSAFEVKIPEYYRYKISMKGYHPVTQVKNEMVNESYFIRLDRGEMHRENAQALSLKYAAYDVPAIKDEPFITTMEDYTSKVEFELATTKFPGSLYKDYNSTWPKVIKQLMDDESFGKYFTRSNYSKSLLPGILKTETNPIIQIQLIYNHVKNTLKWNERYSKYTTENSVKSIFDKKSGNSADINLTLLSLLREAKIQADPVLVSTRENGSHPGHPMVSKFNNVVVAVEIDQKTILLDAANKFLAPDLISYQNLNQQGLKINTAIMTGGWIPMQVMTPSRNTVYYNLKLTEDHKLTGDLFLSANNYFGLSERTKYSNAANETEHVKNYIKNKPGLAISDYKIENLNDPGEILTETMKVVIEDNVEEAGDLVLLNPLLFERTKENPFKLEERNFPVDFAYPIEENIRVTIEFPKNYKLENMPVNGRVVLPNKDASFTYFFAKEDNKIALTSRISITKAVYTADDYHNLKELFRNIIEKQAQQIVFKKI